MFIDDVKNRYTYLNSMKNVVHEEPLERAVVPHRTIIIDPDMEPVLDRLLRERPTWRFKSTEHFYGHGGVRTATNFEIYDGDEALGRLWTERHWRDGTVRYNFDNFRLEKARQRNSVSFTTKPAEAVKRIVKAFHLKTPSERALDAFNDLRDTINKAAADNNWSLRKAKSSIERRLFDYAAKHWDEMKHHVTDDPDKLDFPTLVQADRDAQEMSEAFSGQGGTVVRIESNGTYMMARKADNGFAIETFNDSTLPDHVRGTLGLLKMLDDKSYVPGVGARANAKLYFVMDKKGESNDA